MRAEDDKVRVLFTRNSGSANEFGTMDILELKSGDVTTVHGVLMPRGQEKLLRRAHFELATKEDT